MWIVSNVWPSTYLRLTLKASRTRQIAEEGIEALAQILDIRLGRLVVWLTMTLTTVRIDVMAG